MRQARFVSCITATAAVALVLAQLAGGQSQNGNSTLRSLVTIRGSGSRVVAVRLGRSSPLVVTASSTGQANFIVHLVGRGGTEYLFNVIGRYSGQMAVADAKAGRYRVVVEDDGSWSLAFNQPFPSPKAKRIPGTITGHGDRVIAIRSTRHLQPVVTASHNGQSNFIVHLIGYGTTTGELPLFNEIGRFHGQTLIDDLPNGPFLLAVQADGAWSVRFTP